MLSSRNGGLLATVSVAALAAACPATAQSVTPWAGYYIGANAGAAFLRTTQYDMDGFGTVFDPFLPMSTRIDRWIALGGGHVGHNWQSQGLVYGVEADFALGFGGNDIHLVRSVSSPVSGEVHSNRLQWLSTFRGRVGYARGDTFAYVTGGLAAASVKNRFAFSDFLPGYVYRHNDSKPRLGWTAGGGVEHRFARNWSARIEGLYVDLADSRTVGLAAAPTSGGTDFGFYRSRWDNTAIIGRAGLTYHWIAAN